MRSLPISTAVVTVLLSFAAPRALRAQEAATVCADGTTDVRASCAEHGGVDSAATAAARRAVRPPTKKEATWSSIAVCVDGTREAPSGPATCTGHGGVDHTIMSSQLGPAGAPNPERDSIARNRPAVPPCDEKARRAGSCRPHAPRHE